jgi:hypothetical protein
MPSPQVAAQSPQSRGQLEHVSPVPHTSSPQTAGAVPPAVPVQAEVESTTASAAAANE